MRSLIAIVALATGLLAAACSDGSRAPTAESAPEVETLVLVDTTRPTPATPSSAGARRGRSRPTSTFRPAQDRFRSSS
jgi:hypothetical protein